MFFLSSNKCQEDKELLLFLRLNVSRLATDRSVPGEQNFGEELAI